MNRTLPDEISACPAFEELEPRVLLSTTTLGEDPDLLCLELGTTDVSQGQPSVDSDDAYEENDTRATAYVGVPKYIWLSNYLGLGVQSDDDWYQISVTPGNEHLEATLYHTHAQGDIDLQVVDSSGSVWATANSTTDNEFIDTILPSGGTWYLRVYYADAGNTYDLKWMVSGVTDDVYEENDTRGTAYTGPPEDVWLTFVDGPGQQHDDDWYQVSVTSGQERLEVQLQFLHAQGNIDLQVVDSSGTVWATANSTTNDEEIDTRLPSAGTWYLRVYGDNAGNDYDLKWGQSPVPDHADTDLTAFNMAPSVMNPGDHPTSLTYSIYNTPPPVGWQDLSNDPYRLDVWLSLDNIIDGGLGDDKIGTNDIQLTIPLGDTGNYSASPAELNSITIPTMPLLTPGYRYVGGHVYPRAGAPPEGNPVNNWLAGNQVYVDDAYEQNDTRATAYTGLPRNTNLTDIAGYGGQVDDDWYQIDVRAGYENLIVSAAFYHSEGDIDVQVVDSSGTVWLTANSSTDNESIDTILPWSGTWYLRVYGADAGNTYNLWWNDVYVTPADVALMSVNVAPSLMKPGDHPTSLNYSIYNGGPQSLSNDPYKLDVYLSTDTTIDAGDTKIGTNDIQLTILSGGTGNYSASPAELSQLTVPSGLTPGDYYIGGHVYPWGAPTDPNDATNWHSGNQIYVDDAYEENDTRPAAYVGLSEQTWLSTIAGYGGQKDDDWYEINVASGCENLIVDLRFTHAEGDIDLQVVDSGGGVWASATSSTDNEYLDVVLPSTGTWYLRVYFWNAGNTYDLWWKDQPNEADVALTALSAGPPVMNPGDNPTGLSYTIDNAGPRDLVNHPYLVDVYLSIDDTITAGDTKIGDNAVPLTVASGGTLNYSASPAELSELTIPSGLMPGDYYVGAHVSPNPDPADPNDADNWLAGNQVYVDDAYEDNDTRGTAYAGLPAQTWLSSVDGYGGQKDDDWYEINIPSGYENLVVDLQFTHAEGDIDLQVVDSAGSVWATSESVTDNESINTILPSAGTWYLRVYYANAGNTYDLWWDGLAVPRLAVNDVSQAEGTNGSTDFIFDVTLSQSSTETVTVNYTTADGTATAGSDYTATSGILTFTPGQTHRPITVPVTADSTLELTETFYVNLSAPTWAILSDSQGEGEILTDEPPIPGDANLDNLVDSQDFTILKAHFGQDPAAWADGNFNPETDTIVDTQDFTILKDHFGQSGAPVPAGGAGALAGPAVVPQQTPASSNPTGREVANPPFALPVQPAHEWHAGAHSWGRPGRHGSVDGSETSWALVGQLGRGKGTGDNPQGLEWDLADGLVDILSL